MVHIYAQSHVSEVESLNCIQVNMEPAAVSLDTHRVVSVAGCKDPWVIKQNDVMTIDEDVFVKLNTRNSSLSTMLGNQGGFRCLSRSNGYHELLKLRNDKAFAAETGCNLFETPKKKPKRKSLQRHAADRMNPGSISVVLNIENSDYIIKIVRPSMPTDCLFVAFEQDTIQPVIRWLQDKGFKDVNPKRTPKPTLPKGIYRHPKGFTVSYTDSDGSKRRKLKAELSEALIFLANPHIDDKDDDEDDECDDGDEDQDGSLGDDKENVANAADEE